VGHEVFAISPAPGAEYNLASGVFVQGQPTDDAFIVGPENRLLGSIANCLLKGEGNYYSPVLLCGSTGTGKTHLAHAIAQSRANAVHIHGADFARELADAVHRQSMSDFRDRYRMADLFVLDDLQQLNGRRAAWEELQHTLDALEAREATAVITSRTVPDQMADLPAALCSRLNRGLVISVSAPGIAARQDILQRLAAQRNISLSAEAATSFAEALNVTASELRGHFIKLELSVQANHKPTQQESTANAAQANHADFSPLASPSASIELPDVRRYLSQLRSQHRPSLKQISTVVAKYYGLKPSAISSASRQRQLVLARSMAIYLGRTLCDASLKTLGQHFGGRDHTTALHSFRQVRDSLPLDTELNAAVNVLQTVLTKTLCESHGGN
jgi:chromosomal replication initiator protein